MYHSSMFDINKIQFEEIPSKIVEIGELYAESKSHFDFLSDMTKVELSKYAGKEEWSEATRSRLAYANLLFSDHLWLIKTTQKDMLRYQAYMKALEAKFELCRSMNSLRKAEMRIN